MESNGGSDDLKISEEIVFKKKGKKRNLRRRSKSPESDKEGLKEDEDVQVVYVCLDESCVK